MFYWLSILCLWVSLPSHLPGSSVPSGRSSPLNTEVRKMFISFLRWNDQQYCKHISVSISLSLLQLDPNTVSNFSNKKISYKLLLNWTNFANYYPTPGKQEYNEAQWAEILAAGNYNQTETHHVLSLLASFHHSKSSQWLRLLWGTLVVQGVLCFLHSMQNIWIGKNRSHRRLKISLFLLLPTMLATFICSGHNLPSLRCSSCSFLRARSFL